MDASTDQFVAVAVVVGAALAVALVAAVGVLALASAASGRQGASGVLRGNRLVGSVAQVLVAIPAQGSGSARVFADTGGALLMPACGLDGMAIASGSEAVVVALGRGSVVLAPMWPEVQAKILSN